MNRIQGIIGIYSKMSNLNADFERMPRQTSEGYFFSTDKAIKFLYRDAMDKGTSEKILMKRSMKLVKDKTGNELIIPRTLPEKYEYLFGKTHKESSTTEVLKNIFNCLDVRFFGATFAEANISAAGAIQFGMGFNVYEDVTLMDIDITSPFRNSASASEFASQTTLGKATVTEEAHYMFPFVITPNNYKEFVEAGALEKPFTEEDYKKFKMLSLICATEYRSASKNNIGNELALFIEFSGNFVIHGLENKIKFSNSEIGLIADLTELTSVINKMDSKIKNVDLYIDTKLIEVKGASKLIKVKDITTEEVL